MHNGEATGRRLIRLLSEGIEELRQEYSVGDDIDAMVLQYRSDWEHSCVVIVGGRARRHALQLNSLCTCRECILYTACEHTAFVDGLDLPIRSKLRDFTLFAS